MTIILRPDQERLLMDAVKSGLAQTPDQALDQALEALRHNLPAQIQEAETAAAVRRLASFGRRHGLSLGGSTVKDLLRESRP